MITEQDEKRHDELAALLAGVDGLSVASVDPASMYTVEQVADLTGATDKVVRRAIDGDTLEAYQCGQVVKIKGADVHLWLAGVRR